MQRQITVNSDVEPRGYHRDFILSRKLPITIHLSGTLSTRLLFQLLFFLRLYLFRGEFMISRIIPGILGHRNEFWSVDLIYGDRKVVGPL
jgi:hypothetical protein